MNKLYEGECLEVMKTLKDKSINHIVSDFPFYGVVENDWDNVWKNLDEYLDFCEKIFIEYKRLLKDDGNIFIFTGRQYNRHIATILDKYFIEKRIIIWSRKRNFNNTRGKALASGYEPICYYCNSENSTFNNVKIKIDSKRKEYTEGFLKDGICLSDVWSDISALPHNSKEKLKHPTQKPLKLIERIVEICSCQNDIILDNFAGSGTLGEACTNLNRNSILIEKDKNYLEIIKNRIVYE